MGTTIGDNLSKVSSLTYTTSETLEAKLYQQQNHHDEEDWYQSGHRGSR